MSNIVGGQIIWNLDVEKSKYDSAMADASKTAERTGKDVDNSMRGIGVSFRDLGRNMTDVGRDMSIAFTAPITAIGATAIKFTEVAGRFSSVQDAFKSMTKDMNIDSNKFLKDVAAATGGQLDQLTILQGATRGLALIGKDAFNDFGTDFVKMAEMSKKAARATGQDVDFMFNSLVLGISRESKLLLDNLGVSLDVTKAKEDYALSLGKTTDELTQSESKHAVLTATMKQLEATYGNVAVSAGGFTGAWQQLNTVITDSKIKIGQELEPELAKLTKDFTDLIKDILPEIIKILREVILWWTSLDDTTQKNIISFIAIVATLGPVLVILGTFVSAITGIITAVGSVIGVIGKFSIVLKALGVLFGVIKAGAIILGTFLAGISAPVWIVIGAIAALIAIGVLLWKNWDWVSAKAREVWNILAENIRFIVNAWWSIPGQISRALSGVVDAITRPFREAWRYVENIARNIREALDQINPFHRNSPSLVDNVIAGVKEIKKQYAGLTSIQLPSISSQSPSISYQGEEGSFSSKDVTVNIGEVRNMQDIEMISREIGYRFSLI